MAQITLDPTRTKAGWNLGPAGGQAPADATRTPAAVHWDVKPTPGETVRLSTGGELKTLPGSVYITIGDAGPEGQTRYTAGSPLRWGGLRHFGSSQHNPEGFYVTLHVSERLFNSIQHSVERGQIPSLVLWFGSGRTDMEADEAPEPIKYGMDPDGSGVDWDNKKHPYVEVAWYQFLFDSGLAASEEDESLPDPGSLRVTKADLKEIAQDLAGVRQLVSALGGQVRTALWVIAALLVGLLLRR